MTQPATSAANTPNPMAGATDAQPLALNPIHLPADISAWPLAPGWWLLLAVVIAVATAAFFWHRRYRRLAFRREALALLASIEQQQNPTALQTIDAISALLKRVAITAHGRESVAGRTGDSWLQFLDETGKTHGFTQGPGRSLGANRFQPNIAIDAPALIALCRDWIQKQSC